MNYEELKKLYDCVVDGYRASARGEFPPVNPHAPLGISPGRSDENPKGAAWFHGYWSRAQEARRERT